MRKILLPIVFLSLVFTMCGCNQAEKVSYNLSKEANNFNVVRQLTVINCIQGDVLFQMTGKMSIAVDKLDNQLEVTVEDEYGKYQKHFIGLSDNVTYTVEQKQYQNIENYKYVLNFNPKMWFPVSVDTID
jgi:type III secretory pathway lipoprotein EscJ